MKSENEKWKARQNGSMNMKYLLFRDRMLIPSITCLLGTLLFRITSFATANTLPPKAWEFASTTQLWIKSGINSLQDTPLVSVDSPLAMPKTTTGILLREDFSAKNENSEWVFRPSLAAYSEVYRQFLNNLDQKKTKQEFRINELYLRKEHNSLWSSALGLQNYQWGPAELMSPSNPLFHFSSQALDPSYQIPGHSLARLNYTPLENLNFVGLYEFAPNEEKSFIYDTPFTPLGLIKFDYRLPTPTDYLGLTIGNEQMHDPFIGEYGNITLDDGFSIYFDIKQTTVSKRYYPHVDYGQPPRMNLYDYHDSIYMLSLIGFRIETDDFDFRWEEISNELGFTQNEMNNVARSLDPSTTPIATQNIKSFLHNGRELISKGYTYLSVRSKKLIPWLDSSIALRTLYVHRDESSLGTLQWDGSIGERGTFFINVQSAFGKKNTEMNMLFKSKLSCGLQWIW